MQAVIFAGGEGRRMKGLFPDTQKCMVPVAGKPVLQYQIECLKKYDVTDIIIYVCHKSEQIKDYFRDGSDFGVNIRYYGDKRLRSTADHLKDMADMLQPAFMVLYGDQVIKNVNLHRFMNRHTNEYYFVTFMTHGDFHPEDSDRISIENHKAVKFGRIDVGQTYAGIFLARKELLRSITKSGLDLSNDIFPELVRHHHCGAYITPGYIKDIGTPERYQKALEDLNGDFKVLFIYPNMFTPYAFSPAIQLLSAMLKAKKINTGLVHIHNQHGVPDDDGTILQYVVSHRPKVICFTATSFEFERVKEIASMLKKEIPNVPIVLGGSHATICPEDFNDSPFDAFFIGEGEDSFVEFILKYKHHVPYIRLPNFLFRKDGGIIRNPQGSICMNLNLLPPLDLDIMDTEKLIKVRNGWFSISMSRGCPFECSYCINHLYKKLKGKGIPMTQYIRKRTPTHIMRELEDIVRRFPSLKVFNFDDDLVMLYPHWMKHFCSLYKKRVFDKSGVGYYINARADTLSFSMVRILSESGCLGVRVGVECGNEQTRLKILNKTITNQQLELAFDNCGKRGLRAEAFVMIGLPHETKKDIKETMDLMIRLKPPLIRLSILHPFKYTKIYDYCIQHKLFRKGCGSNDIFTFSPLRFKDMTQKDIVGYHMMFAWYLNDKIYPQSPYANLIRKYSHYPAEKLISLSDKIIHDDQKIDKTFKKPHFRIYPRSSYYVEFIR